MSIDVEFITRMLEGIASGLFSSIIVIAVSAIIFIPADKDLEKLKDVPNSKNKKKLRIMLKLTKAMGIVLIIATAILALAISFNIRSEKELKEAIERVEKNMPSSTTATSTTHYS